MIYMKVVKRISTYLAQELGLSAKKKDRIRFGLELLLSQFISIFFTLLLAYFLKILSYVVIILLISGLFKMVVGGIHFKTVLECAFFSSIFANSFGFVAFYFHQHYSNESIIFFLLSSIIIIISLYLWSPAKVENKPLTDENKKRKLKFSSIIFASFFILIVLTLFYFYKDKYNLINISIISGLLFLVFTINPIMYKLHDLYYDIKSKLFKSSLL